MFYFNQQNSPKLMKKCDETASAIERERERVRDNAWELVGVAVK